jgi:hypothetical protein
MYFESHPKIEYRFPNLRTVTMMDIFRSVKFTQQTLRDPAIFDFVKLEDGSTPEVIAQEVYGDPFLFWLVLMSNDIIDFNTEWPRFTGQEASTLRSSYGGGYSFYFSEEMDIKRGDIIATRDASADGDVGTAYGIVSDYYEPLNKANVIHNTFSSLTTGTSGLDSFYVFRRNGPNSYTRLSAGFESVDYLQPKRIDKLVDSVVYFKFDNVIVSPLANYSTSGAFTFTRDKELKYSSNNRKSSQKTLTRAYLDGDDDAIRNDNIEIVKFEDELPSNKIENSIKVIKKKYVSDVIIEVQKLIRGYANISGLSVLKYDGSYRER